MNARVTLVMLLLLSNAPEAYPQSGLTAALESKINDLERQLDRVSSESAALKNRIAAMELKRVGFELRIEPTETFQIVTRASAGGLTYDGEYLWISAQSTLVADQLLKYSTKGEMLSSIELRDAGNVGGGMTFDGKHPYVLDYANRIQTNAGIKITGNGAVLRVEEDGTLTPYLRLPRDQFNTFGIAFHQGVLYYGHSPTMIDPSSIFKVTPEKGTTKAADVDFYINSLGSDGSALWASDKDSIMILDGEYRTIRKIATSFTIKAFAWVDKDLWAIEKNANRLHRFAGLGNQTK